MKTVILKFLFRPDNKGEVKINMPINAKVLKVKLHNGVPTLWAECLQLNNYQTQCFKVFATGEVMDLTNGNLKYVGTYFTKELAWHLYQQKNYL